MVHVLQLMSYLLTHCFPLKKIPWLHQGSSLYTLSVDKCVMTSIHHYSVFKAALNFLVSYLLPLLSSWPLVPDNHRSLSALLSFIECQRVAMLQYAATSVWFLTCSNVHWKLHHVTAYSLLALNNATCLHGPQFTPPLISGKASRLLSSFSNHDERY